MRWTTRRQTCSHKKIINYIHTYSFRRLKAFRSIKYIHVVRGLKRPLTYIEAGSWTLFSRLWCRSQKYVWMSPDAGFIGKILSVDRTKNIYIHYITNPPVKIGHCPVDLQTLLIMSRITIKTLGILGGIRHPDTGTAFQLLIMIVISSNNVHMFPQFLLD